MNCYKAEMLYFGLIYYSNDFGWTSITIRDTVGIALLNDWKHWARFILEKMFQKCLSSYQTLANHNYWLDVDWYGWKCKMNSGKITMMLISNFL